MGQIHIIHECWPRRRIRIWEQVKTRLQIYTQRSIDFTDIGMLSKMGMETVVILRQSHAGKVYPGSGDAG